ncbi:MAG TPA: ferritin family protein [Longilinea sp.]|nr:ferritin family protein [Longilinea sp.]
MKSNQAAELLELSLEYENNARAIYLKWSELFAGAPEAAEFWSGYAFEEAVHARLLETLRERLTPEQLAMNIENDLAGDTRRLLVFLQKEQKIEDLEQAYQTANMIETSEINPLFELVMSTFESDQKAITFLRSQLDEHVAKLIYHFPKQYARPEQRRAVKVQP